MTRIAFHGDSYDLGAAPATGVNRALREQNLDGIRTEKRTDDGFVGCDKIQSAPMHEVASGLADTEAVQASDDCSAGIVIMATGMPMTMPVFEYGPADAIANPR